MKSTGTLGHAAAKLTPLEAGDLGLVDAGMRRNAAITPFVLIEHKQD